MLVLLLLDMKKDQFSSHPPISMTSEQISMTRARRCGFQPGPVRIRSSCTGSWFLLIFPLDRILYRGDQLDLAVYSRAELKGSDHRPVFAVCCTRSYSTILVVTLPYRSSALKSASSIRRRKQRSQICYFRVCHQPYPMRGSTRGWWP